MKSVPLIFAFLLCSGLGYSQTYKLQHLETNNYKVKTVHLNENNLCTVIYKNYDELEKDVRKMMNTIKENVKALEDSFLRKLSNEKGKDHFSF